MIERLLALALLGASVVYVANALPMPLGTAARPGAGFFPLGVGVFGTAVALAWVFSAFRAPVTIGAHAAPVDGGRRVLAAAGALVGFCVLLSWVGYPLAAFGFVTFLLRSLGSGWRAAIALGLGSTVVSYYFFAVLLGVPMPRGVFLD